LHRSVFVQQNIANYILTQIKADAGHRIQESGTRRYDGRQYSSRFIELARFGQNLILDEESKVEHFENGLNPHIKERVMCHEIRNFVKLVNIASVAERGMRESFTAYKLKRRAMSQVTYPSK
jgi:hypothetical protein